MLGRGAAGDVAVRVPSVRVPSVRVPPAQAANSASAAANLHRPATY